MRGMGAKPIMNSATYPAVRPPARDELDPIETASRDEIEALQLSRLQAMLSHAYEHIPVYRARFDQAGVSPSDLNSLGDLSRFPFTYKDDLRQNYPFGMFAVPREQIVRIHASSGTTGTPTVVGYTRNDLKRTCRSVPFRTPGHEDAGWSGRRAVRLLPASRVIARLGELWWLAETEPRTKNYCWL